MLLLVLMSVPTCRCEGYLPLTLLVYTGHECDIALNLYHSIAIQLMITHQAVYISITICITLMLCF